VEVLEDAGASRKDPSWGVSGPMPPSQLPQGGRKEGSAVSISSEEGESGKLWEQEEPILSLPGTG
jgi:hypothetical protein